jgi:DNA-binding NtrC family response regulator
MTDRLSAGKQKHLLVVDDNRDLAETYRHLFQMHGYEVSLAGNGVQALTFIQDPTLDAILCDLSMPEMEGDAFHEAVNRVQPRLSDRFIFVTGHSGNPRFEKFLKRSGCPVLYKPVPIDILLKTLSGIFDRV